MMKKSFFFAGLAAALCLVGCNKESDVKGLDGRPVEIVLSDAATRTVNEGMSTKWVNGDALNVFYAPTGTTEYSGNVEFKVDDAANNHAKGTAELTADAYDWYLLYPYSKYVTTPANTKSGYLTIGSKSNATQTQAGPDSMTHLAGENLPVYGVAKNVARDDTPVISMKHVASVVAVNLTNATAAPIKVNEVSFTAPEDIVGTYYIDFSGEELAFAGSGANYVSNVATLAVTGDATIAAGASAKFYLAVKPFAAKAADKLSVKAHVGDLVFEKEIALPSAVEFKSGVIKQLNVSYTGGTEIQGSSLEDIIAMDKDTEIQTNEVLVVAKYARGIMLAENGSYLLAFNNDGVTGEIGDIVTVSGKVGEYAGLKQIASPEVTVISSDNEVVLPEPKVLETLDEYASDKVELIQYTGTLAVSGNYFNVSVAGSTRKGSIQYPVDAEALKALDKKPITATGFFTGITGGGSYVNMMSTSVEEATVNVFDVTPQQINVAATAISAEINVTGNVDWTAEPSEGATVDKTSGSGDGVITVSFPANTDPENTKDYTVFVRTEATGVNDEFEVNITQAKADAAGVTSATIDFSEQGYENGAEVTAVTGNGVTATFDKGTGSYAPKYYTSGTAVRAYGGNTLTVTANGKTIVSVELTFSSGEGTNEITTDVPTYAEPLWTGESGSVTFTVGGTTGHRRIKAITVKYSGEAAPAATLESIAVSGQTTTYTVGDTFEFDGTVTATYSDGSKKTVSPTSVSKPDMTTAGTKEVTVSYTEGEVTKTAQYDITVNAAATHAGTADDPYTVAEAMAATDALGEGKTSSEYFYTKGIISEITEVSTQHGNATYFISDDGTTATQFKVFRGKYIGNINFSAEDQIKVGDEVVINGKLTYYKPSTGASEIEIASGNYIYSLKRGGAAVYALGAVASETNVASAASSVKVNVYGNVDWTASVDGGASLSTASGSGIGSFNVSIPANETAEAKTYTVTVATTASVSNSPVVLTVTQDAKGAGNQIVLDLSTATYSTATEETVVWETDAMTITVNKGSASTSANNYLGGDANNRTSSRFYKGSEVIFAPKSGVTVTSMVCKATSENYATALASSTWTNASAAASGTNVTVTPQDGANAMTAAIGGTCGFTQIVINY